MKMIQYVRVGQCLLVFGLVVTVLNWRGTIQAGESKPLRSATPPTTHGPNCGIDGQTLVHDPRVATFAGQLGGTGPFQASLRIYAASSRRLVTTVRTDAEGRFQLRLQPGSYVVVPNTMWQGRPLEPNEIVVGSYEAADPVKVQVRLHVFEPLTITYERMMGF